MSDKIDFFVEDVGGGELADILLPSSNGIHSLKRVLLFDHLKDAVISIVNSCNGSLSIMPTSEYKNRYNRLPMNGRRYLYHGGDRGEFGGFFAFTDALVVVGKTVASVPFYNVPHLFCDIYDTDDKCVELAVGLKRNGYAK